MLSESLIKKWKKLLRENYGIENPIKEEIFEFVNNLTTFFNLLIRFDQEDKSKNRNNEKR